MKSTIRIAATETASLNSTAWFPPPPPPQLMTEKNGYAVSDDEISRQIREADEDSTVLTTFEELVAGSHPRGG